MVQVADHRRRQTAKLVQFTWDVPQSGFSWQEPRLVAYLPVGDWRRPKQRFLSWDFQGPSRSYRPLEEPALFRTFASTALTEEGILDFATKYGPLGAEYFRIKHDKPHKRVHLGETFKLWQGNIRWMNRAVQIWDAYRTNSRKRKRLLLPLLNEVDRRLAANRYKYVLRSTGPSEDEIVLRDPLERARVVLSWLVDLYVHAIPLAFDHSLHLSIEPMTLRDALWLQLATSIEGEKDYGRCEWCNQWFLIPPKASGRKRFCKDSCRVMASQRRHRSGRIRRSGPTTHKDRADEKDV